MAPSRIKSVPKKRKRTKDEAHGVHEQRERLVRRSGNLIEKGPRLLVPLTLAHVQHTRRHKKIALVGCLGTGGGSLLVQPHGVFVYEICLQLRQNKVVRWDFSPLPDAKPLH